MNFHPSSQQGSLRVARRGSWSWPSVGLVVGLICASILAIGLAPADASTATKPKPEPTLVDIQIPAVKGPIDDKWLPGYTGGPRAMVLLPAGYNPNKKYPLLVLLEGITSNYKMWSQDGLGQIAKTAAGLDAIIVMPEGGNGWYADWWNRGRRGGPSWETYILDDLVPYVMKQYPIRPERRWHALAGSSMGGMGSAYLGGRLPGFFGSVAVMSGLADTQLIPGATTLESFIPQYHANQKHAPVPIDFQAVYGPEYGFYANGHNPKKLAANLAHTRLYLTVGNGTATDDGEPFTPQQTDGLGEALILRPAMTNFSRSLRVAKIPHTFKVHKGAHSWPNFRQELRDAIAWDLFAPVEENPSSWVNDTVATHGNLWGFGYTFISPPTKVVRFARKGELLTVSAAGSPVTLTLSDTCTITTPTPAKVVLSPSPCPAKPAR